MSPLVYVLTILFGLLGVADASYITYEEFSGVIPPCLPLKLFDCGAVLGSAWSHIGPIPLSLLGLGFYALVALMASWLLLKETGPWWRLPVLRFLTFFGFLFSVYLLIIQIFFVSAFCTFCLVSAAISSSLFATQAVGSWFPLRPSTGK